MKSPAHVSGGAFALNAAETPAGEIFAEYQRESNERPMLNAFCRVAPSLRFKVLAIFPAGIFFRADDFNSRISADVQERLLDGFFTICSLSHKSDSAYS